MLFPGVLYRLVAQHVERAADPPARVPRPDYLIDIPPLRRNERVGEAVLVFRDTGSDLVGVAEL